MRTDFVLRVVMPTFHEGEANTKSWQARKRWQSEKKKVGGAGLETKPFCTLSHTHQAHDQRMSGLPFGSFGRVTVACDPGLRPIPACPLQSFSPLHLPAPPASSLVFFPQHHADIIAGSHPPHWTPSTLLNRHLHILFALIFKLHRQAGKPALPHPKKLSVLSTRTFVH